MERRPKEREMLDKLSTNRITDERPKENLLPKWQQTGRRPSQSPNQKARTLQLSFVNAPIAI